MSEDKLELEKVIGTYQIILNRIFFNLEIPESSILEYKEITKSIVLVKIKNNFVKRCLLVETKDECNSIPEWNVILDPIESMNSK